MPSIQFDITDEKELDQLFDLTAQIAKRERKRIGIGTVAKRLLEALLAHPETIQQFMDDETSIGIGEKRTGETANPKAGAAAATAKKAHRA